MCTAIIHVPAGEGPVRLLAVRDEDPARPWRGPGEHWPGVVGVQDVQAGGAWLAASPDAGRVAVVLNRTGGEGLPDDAVVSRGTLPLASVSGEGLPAEPPMRGFNLLEAGAGGGSGWARVASWDGERLSTTGLGPGTHMIAHDGVDDPATARIVRWLDAFRAAPPGDGDRWYAPWLEVLARSAELGPDDDAAIIRDNRAHGYPTLSLLVCAATVGRSGTDVRGAALPEPAAWGDVELA